MRSGTGARLVAKTASGNEGAHKHGGRRSIPNRYEHTASTSSKPFGHTHRWHARTNRAAATETRVANRRPPGIMTPTNATSQHPFAKGAPQTRSLACKHAARDFKWDVELRLQCPPPAAIAFRVYCPIVWLRYATIPFTRSIPTERPLSAYHSTTFAVSISFVVSTCHACVGAELAVMPWSIQSSNSPTGTWATKRTSQSEGPATIPPLLFWKTMSYSSWMYCRRNLT